MLELFIGAYASLSFNLVGWTIFITYPSYAKVLTACVNEFRCITPTNSVVDAVPWEEHVDYVKALVVFPDGREEWLYSYTIAPYKG